MKHKMHLSDSKFNQIKNGTKSVEMRVNDSKRQLINIGDEIEFINRETNEVVYTKIINIKTFTSFKELYRNYDKKVLGYKEDEIANPLDMERYYSKEEQDEYGVVAIELSVTY